MLQTAHCVHRTDRPSVMSNRSVIVVSAVRSRTPGLLPWPSLEGLEDPTVSSVGAAAAGCTGPLWVGGGEPTLRRDLPRLIETVAEASDAPVGLDTDGLALAGAGVVAGLMRCGVGRVRIGLHCGRPDAHDWLVGCPGAARKVRRAIGTACAAGLPVTVRCFVTRPTMDWLEETAHLVSRLGASALELVRLPARGPAAERFVTLSPRIGLAEPFLHAAVGAAKDAGMKVRLVGWPRCAVPRVSERLLANEVFVVPEASGLEGLAALLGPQPHGPGCAACPGAPTCEGPPADYTAVFGRSEVDSERPTALGVPRPAPPEPGIPPQRPPPRRGRTPATRLRFIERQAAFPDLGGDPMAGERPGPDRTTATLAFGGTSRQIRREMARVCQEGISVLRLQGSGVFGHPDASALIRDALRLGVARVEAVGDVRPLARLVDREIVGLRGLALLQGLTPAGADPVEIDAVLARFSRLAGVEVRRLPLRCEDAASEEP